MRTKLTAGVVVAWALITWGGRIGLLTAPEAASPVTWVRVVGSLLAAGIGAYGVLGHRRGPVWVFVAWTVGIWGSSLVSVWTTEHALGFRLFHTLLAVVSAGVAALALAVTLAGGGGTVRGRHRAAG